MHLFVVQKGILIMNYKKWTWDDENKPEINLK